MKHNLVEDFKTEYKECKTFGDFDRLLEKLDLDFAKKLQEHLTFVQETTGFTMREDAFLQCLNCYLKYVKKEVTD